MHRKLIAGWSISGLLSVILILISSCQANDGKVATVEMEELSGRLTFAGSTTVQPLANLLKNDFMVLHPQVVMEIAAGGSKVGIQAVHDGVVDIGMASRNLSEEERQGIEQYQIAVDVIAIVINPINPINNLTLDELRRIYLGEITRWNEVGGEDADITTVIREETSGTRGAFDELVLGGAAPNGNDMRAAITAGDVAAMVANDPLAIGYVGFGNFEKDIKVLSINGVSPSPETARDQSYIITRPLLFLTGPLSQPLANDFIGFVLSSEGQALVGSYGWIPVH